VGHRYMSFTNKRLSEENKALWEELGKVKAEVAVVVSKVAHQNLEPAPKA